MWLTKYVCCAFLIHLVLISVTCEDDKEITVTIETSRGEDNNRPAKHATKNDKSTKLPAHGRGRGHHKKKPTKSEYSSKTNNNNQVNPNDAMFRSDFTMDAVHNLMHSATEGIKRLFTAGIRSCNGHKSTSAKFDADDYDYDYTFRDSAGKNHHKKKSHGKESKKAVSPQHKNRFTPRKFTQYDDHKIENDAPNFELKAKPRTETSVVYGISEDDIILKSNYSNDDINFENTLYNLLFTEPKYFLEVRNLIKGLLKGNDIRHLEGFNVLPHLSHKSRDTLDIIQKHVPYVDPKIREIMNNELEMGTFRKIELQNQMLENEIPIGRAVQYRPFVKKEPKNTIVIVVPPKKPKNMKVDEFTDVQYDIEMDGLTLSPTYRANIRTGSLEFGSVIVTFYPSGKQFIIERRKLFICDGYISEQVFACIGRLKPFVPTKLEDNCYLNNFPKALGHVCLSKSGKDVYMFYREGRLICQTDAEDVQHLTFEVVNKLCSKVASYAIYKFRDQFMYDLNEEFGVLCTEKLGQVCQLNQSLVLSRDSKIPLNV